MNSLTVKFVMKALLEMKETLVIVVAVRLVTNSLLTVIFVTKALDEIKKTLVIVVAKRLETKRVPPCWLQTGRLFVETRKYPSPGAFWT